MALISDLLYTSLMPDLAPLSIINFPSVRVWDSPSHDQFWNEIYPLGEPAILRGHCAQWGAAKMNSADNKAFATYLHGSGPNGEVNAFVGRGDIGGRFFYNDDLSGFNFDRASVPFSAFLTKLLNIEREGEPVSIYVGATSVHDLIPRFLPGNQSPLPPEGTPPLAWIGNASRVAPHFDTSDNIACVVRGRRTFLLYPPEQVENLYVGPLDHNMAGQPASLVDPRAPDLDAFPKYKKAETAAIMAELEPGDAIFIPALWWHYVESYSPFSMLVNYWWSQADTGHGLGSLAHAIMALRELPDNQRNAWQKMFNHYVFNEDAGAAAEHLPDQVRGILSAPSPERDHKIKSFLQMILR